MSNTTVDTLAAARTRWMQREYTTTATIGTAVSALFDAALDMARSVRECERRLDAHKVYLNKLLETEPEEPAGPQFAHDCPHCVFLGRWQDGAETYDLYYCPSGGMTGPTLVARHGNEGCQFLSGLGNSLPVLQEARRRAVECGLLRAEEPKPLTLGDLYPGERAKAVHPDDQQYGTCAFTVDGESGDSRYVDVWQGVLRLSLPRTIRVERLPAEEPKPLTLGDLNKEPGVAFCLTHAADYVRYGLSGALTTTGTMNGYCCRVRDEHGSIVALPPLLRVERLPAAEPEPPTLGDLKPGERFRFLGYPLSGEYVAGEGCREEYGMTHFDGIGVGVYSPAFNWRPVECLPTVEQGGDGGLGRS